MRGEQFDLCSNCLHSKGNSWNPNTDQRQLDNPVYDGSSTTHSQTNYSSTGPAYEHVEAGEEAEYDVINRRGAPRPHPPMKPPGSYDPTLSQDYSILEGNNYHVIQLSNMDNEKHSGVSSNRKQGQVDVSYPSGNNSQDYEMPTSRSGRVQNA